jgi:hypothetical protein
MPCKRKEGQMKELIRIENKNNEYKIQRHNAAAAIDQHFLSKLILLL